MADGPTKTAIPEPGFDGRNGGEKTVDRALRRTGATTREPFEDRERCRKPNATPGDVS